MILFSLFDNFKMVCYVRLVSPIWSTLCTCCSSRTSLSVPTTHDQVRSLRFCEYFLHSAVQTAVGQGCFKNSFIYLRKLTSLIRMRGFQHACFIQKYSISFPRNSLWIRSKLSFSLLDFIPSAVITLLQWMHWEFSTEFSMMLVNPHCKIPLHITFSVLKPWLK
jgi:hypothetical protein